MQCIDGIPFKLKSPFDFSFLSEYGRVFKVFDDQDSGNICFGTEKDGQRYFIKFAGTVLLLCLWTRLFVICIEQKKYRFPLSAPMMRKELTLSYRNIRSFSRERLEKFLYRLYQITNFNPLIPFLLSLFMVYCM